ncbi:MAG TPA: hypothetical protein VFC61_04745 [Blastocatellia bacterium]|jgi:hypothetical protein|nr:hypothetical protein [Blastocatellia bacterium]
MAKTDQKEASGEVGSADRRSFITGMVAGTVAAGSLAASVKGAAAPKVGPASPAGIAAGPAKIMRITFDQSRAPQLEDIFRALEKALGQTGCTRCGFDGIDVLLKKEEIFDPQPQPWVVTVGEKYQGQY